MLWRVILEITKGSEDPYNVAMIPFEGNSRLSKELNSIMQNDLIRTGEFSILDEKLLLPLQIIDDELVYNDWKLLGMDYLVTGKIIKTNNSLDINYEIYDIHKKERLEVLKFLAYPIKLDSLRIIRAMEFMNLLQA